MASLFSQIFGGGSKTEERLDQNAWAQMFEQTFSYQGQLYPLLGYGSELGTKSEALDHNFISYTNNAYKANGIVFACMMVRQRIFTEMTFCYQQMSKGRPVDLFSSKELDVLQHPWPNGTTGELLSRALQDADIAGNHYVVREFDRKTKKSRLRRLRPDWVEIVLTAKPEEAVQSDVAGYLYKPGGTADKKKWVTYPVDGSKGQISHWSPIPDPEAQYRGMSWITPILREIAADKGATTHKQKFFDQGATPQLAVSLKDVTTAEQFKEFMALLDQAHNGVDNAYKTMYLAGGADVTVVGAHLQQLDFRDMQGHGETRIAAAAGIHPVLVGLSEALRGTPLAIGNYQAAKDMAGEMFLRPMWRSLCAAYEPLVHEFPGARLWYDDRDVSFLRQDRQAQADLQLSQAQTANTLVMAGFTPESIVKYMLADGDWGVLEHSGLTSVQLIPPGQPKAAAGGGGSSIPPVPPVPKPDKAKNKQQPSVTPVPKEPKPVPMPSQPGKQIKQPSSS